MRPAVLLFPTTALAIVEAADLGATDIAKCTLYLTDLAHFDTVNAEYAAFFADHTPPDAPKDTHLKRGIKSRQLTMIAIGGAIGTGLWFASGGAVSGAGPGFLAKTNSRGVPMGALWVTGAIAALSFLASLVGEGLIYTFLLNASAIAGFIVWLNIAICHYRFRKAWLA